MSVDDLESPALRQYIYRAAGQPDPDDVNLVEAARRAAQRINDLEQRLSEIEGATGINVENPDYHQLSRPGKIKKLRDALREKAQQNGGKAAMDYSEVASVFDWECSGGHATDLAKAAAGHNDETGNSTKDGYEFQRREGENNRVVVDLEKIDG